MNDLRLPWHRETVGHANVKKIAAKVARDLAVPLDEGVPANTDATWIVNADNKVVAFVGNGPRQTDNADAIIAAVSGESEARAAALREVAEAVNKGFSVTLDGDFRLTNEAGAALIAILTEATGASE